MRQSDRTTNGSPVKRPAVSLGSADARRFIQTTSDAESAREIDSIESVGTGEITPPMKPTLHPFGGGAASSVATAQPFGEADTDGSDAVCTVPLREKRVTSAGCGST